MSALREISRRIVMAALALAAASARPDDGGIRFTAARPTQDSTLMRAHAALMTGDFAAAETIYAKALARDERNADALHGIAALAFRRGDHGRAEAHYRRALAADPTDAVAHAGLHGLGRVADTAQEESRFKTLIAGQPEQHVLRFALGNLYAAQNRWHDARSQYLLAHAADPEQPDYLFNLAVSLEHAQEPHLAHERYQAALAAATRRPASFEPAQATAALRALQAAPQ